MKKKSSKGATSRAPIGANKRPIGQMEEKLYQWPFVVIVCKLQLWSLMDRVE